MGKNEYKTFIRITNQDIWNKIETMRRDNVLQHSQIMEHQMITNGKVKLNTWRSITGLSLASGVLLCLLGLVVKSFI